jgi:hypothetical protein
VVIPSLNPPDLPWVAFAVCAPFPDGKRFLVQTTGAGRQTFVVTGSGDVLTRFEALDGTGFVGTDVSGDGRFVIGYRAQTVDLHGRGDHMGLRSLGLELIASTGHGSVLIPHSTGGVDPRIAPAGGWIAYVDDRTADIHIGKMAFH